MNNEWYRWSSLAPAQACLNYLNAHPSLPITGKSAKTHTPQPDKAHTTQWCKEVTECTDGKFGFPRVGQAWLDTLGIDAAGAQQFLAAFGPTIEEYDNAWMPVDEEA